MDYDLITVGGGLAGLVTAARASQLGLKAAVLERSTEQPHICSSRYATGAFAVMGQPLKSSEEHLYSAIMNGTNDTARPELAKLVVSNVRRAYLWLIDEGGRFIDMPTLGGHSVLAPPRTLKPGLDWEGRGADALMQRLESNILKRGGAFLRGVSVDALLMENGACVGVQASVNGQRCTYRAEAVVIADGGFQANREMVKEYISHRPERILLRAAPKGLGDGIRMAAAVGAEIGGFGKFYGHLQHRDAMSNSKLWPYPQLDAIAEIALLVGADGKRFTDEGLGGVAMTNAVAQLDDPLTTWIVFDNQVWVGDGGRAIPVPANPGLADAGAAILSEATLEDLAVKAGLPVDGLVATVKQHNHAIETNKFQQLVPARTVNTFEPTSSASIFKTSAQPRPIATSPFHAIPVCAGLTLAMGGIRINTNAQALRPTHEPIAGLYVAGTPVAGLEGGPRAGYVGGLCKAFVLGLTAAEHAASTVGKRQGEKE